MRTVTVEQALRYLGDAKAFRDADVGFAHGLIALLRVNVPITGQKRERAGRLLASYGSELAALGMRLDGQAPEPDDVWAPLPGWSQGGAVRVAPVQATTRITVEDGKVIVRAPYVLKDVTGSIAGLKWVKARRYHEGPASGPLAERLVEAFTPTGLEYDQHFHQLLGLAQSIRGAAVHRSADNLAPIPNSKLDGWMHQRQAYWFARDLPAALFDMEMGTGKSKVVTDLIVNSGADSALIVCPEKVVGVWPKQFRLHAGKECHVVDPRRQKRDGSWALMPVAARIERYDEALHECRCGLPHILLTNYAAASQAAFASWSQRQRFGYVVYDESHRLKSPTGAWSKWAWHMAERADRRLGGTGTLMPQSPLDVFGQARALDPGLFGHTKTAFWARYAVTHPKNDKQVVDYKNEDELTERLGTILYRCGEEVLADSLPPVIPDVEVTCRMEPAAWRVYKEVEDDFFSEVEVRLASGMTVKEAISPPNILVKLLRLQQMTGGTAHYDSGAYSQISTAKENLLRDDLEDLPDREPVVVFARFRSDLDAIERVAHELKRPYHELSGRRADALSPDATLAADVVIAGVQLQAGGTGIDFTRSAYATYYSMGTSLGDYRQSRARLRRPGQTRPVRFRHLIVEGSADEDVYEALRKRADVVEWIGEKIRRRQAGS